jgi:DMSO/TMAO reductase YedYZ molybdopterin-dependent catalytic subunit
VRGLRINLMTSETDRSRPFIGALAGLITGVVAVGVGQFVASLGSQDSSPVVAVGQAAIGLAPPPVKDFAISTFGSHDKQALLTGILVLLAVYAAVIGALGARRLAYGLAGLGAFTLIGLWAAGTRSGATAGYFVPTLVAAAASAITMTLLLRNIPPRQAVAQPRAPRVPRQLRPDSLFYTGPAPGRDDQAAPPADETASGAAEPSPVPGGEWWPKTPPAVPDRPGLAPDEQRRAFLVTGAAAVATGAVGYLGGRVLAERGAVTQARASLRLPRPTYRPFDTLTSAMNLNIPGITPFVTSNANFYQVDEELVLPQVAPSSWTLRIHGMVEREIEVTFDQLLRRPLTETYVTLTCVSDPVEGPYISNAQWLGASLADLIREARPKAGAEQLLSTSVDGYTCGTPIQTVLDGRNALLAVGMNGQPLPVAHGFPVRMVVPGLYGYVSATKWVTDLKLTTWGAEYSYWAQRGWSQQAPIKTESRIDVPNGSKTLSPGRTAVAGVAWAQHKGIAAVEVSIDNGPWHEATLAAVPGIDTWRQWVWYWDATPGNHTIQCRATDKTGYTQTAYQTPPEPNGATGYPAIPVMVSK